MAASLFVLLDDISTLLDDVSALTKVAAQKTTGVLGDDLALNAQQVTGVNPDRELPVVWAVAKGSMLNKAILVPVALALSAFWPAGVQWLLMAGGAYLCFEGFEKVAHRLLHSRAEDEAHKAELVRHRADPKADLCAVEKDKVSGAIRTDFVLSAEIVVITLGTLAGEEFLTRVLVLSAIAVAMTVGVYGFVALIVRLDDFGMALRRRGGWKTSIGNAILRAAPWLMRTLSVAGTVAMFLVGGSILSHGIAPLAHAIEAAAESGGAAVSLLSHALVGVVAGALVLAAVTLFTRATGRRRPA